jgi:hypothetical protein
MVRAADGLTGDTTAFLVLAFQPDVVNREMREAVLRWPDLASCLMVNWY